VATLEIIEEDENVLHASIETSFGRVTIMANITLDGGKLLLNQIHVEGRGLTRAIMKRAAEELGNRKGAAEVLLQGGIRTSGANPGSFPKLIRVKVNQ
jgi:hypothetical protein